MIGCVISLGINKKRLPSRINLLTIKALGVASTMQMYEINDSGNELTIPAT
jgi:hypothetical protein